MRNWLLKIYSLLLGLCLLSVFKVDAQNVSPDKLSIITYNIWNGFEGDMARRAKFVSFLKTESPDIVSLNELVGFSEKDLTALAREYGHSYVAIVKEGGYPVGITSKYPISVVTKQIDGFWHGMLHAKILDLDCIVTHLSPFDWKFRLNEATQIVDYIVKNKLSRYIVMGDFNALSPLDMDILIQKDSLLLDSREWDKQQKIYKNLRDGRFDFSVLSKFLSIGMEDVIGISVQPAEARFTYPTAFLYKTDFDSLSVLSRRHRLDYILLSSSLMSCYKDSYIFNDQKGEGISDHYPVKVELEFILK